jgi:hypothetical protein
MDARTRTWPCRVLVKLRVRDGGGQTRAGFGGIGVGALWPTHITVAISLLVEPIDVELERLRLLEAAPHELVHGEYLLAGERNTRESVSTGERDVRENVSACEREG